MIDLFHAKIISCGEIPMAHVSHSRNIENLNVCIHWGHSLGVETRILLGISLWGKPWGHNKLHEVCKYYKDNRDYFLWDLCIYNILFYELVFFPKQSWASVTSLWLKTSIGNMRSKKIWMMVDWIRRSHPFPLFDVIWTKIVSFHACCSSTLLSYASWKN